MNMPEDSTIPDMPPRVRSDFISDTLMVNFYDQFNFYNVDDLRTIGHIDLPHRPGEQLDYICVGDGSAYFIPGFTEGITSKSVFALALSEEVGLTMPLTLSAQKNETEAIQTTLPVFGLTLPDENRTGIDRWESTDSGICHFEEDAIYSQALNNLELILQTRDEASDEPLIIFTHSMGSLIVQEMVTIAQERGLTLFDGAHIVMLAPAALYPQENLIRLGGRFALYAASEVLSHKFFKDTTGEMRKAAFENMRKNPRRSALEVLQLAEDWVDIPELMKTVATLAVVSYGKDYLFGPGQLNGVMGDGATYLTPVSFGQVNKRGHLLSPRAGATHNDEQFNPMRVAKAVRQYLDTILMPDGGETRALALRRATNQTVQSKANASTDDLEVLGPESSDS